MRLRSNQAAALQVSIDNNFQSGTHAHATGTGKSIIGLELIRRFTMIHNKSLIMWLCEQASVIRDIFANNKTNCSVIDLVNNKSQEWADHLGSALLWGRSVLVIVNRAFLVSSERYRSIKPSLDLILHDECHSGAGATMCTF